jgi:hypothetical protein
MPEPVRFEPEPQLEPAQETSPAQELEPEQAQPNKKKPYTTNPALSRDLNPNNNPQMNTPQKQYGPSPSQKLQLSKPTKCSNKKSHRKMLHKKNRLNPNPNTSLTATLTGLGFFRTHQQNLNLPNLNLRRLNLNPFQKNRSLNLKRRSCPKKPLCHLNLHLSQNPPMNCPLFLNPPKNPKRPPWNLNSYPY